MDGRGPSSASGLPVRHRSSRRESCASYYPNSEFTAPCSTSLRSQDLSVIVDSAPKPSRIDLWLALPGILLILVAGWVMIGWATGNQAQTALLASETPMVANTALAFLPIGAAFVAKALGRREVALVAGVFVTLLGLATSFEHLRGLDLRIDELFL